MSILIHNCTAVLMDEAGTVLPNAYVVVEGTKIRSVSTQRPWGSFEEQIDGQGNVLMPGFVNAHSHVPMTAMRATATATTSRTGCTTISSRWRPAGTTAPSGPVPTWAWRR